MQIGPRKAHDHPYGSSVIPTNGALPIQPPTPRMPGAPSAIPRTIGVAGAPHVREMGATSTTPAPSKPSAVAEAVDNLIDAIADKVADKVIAKLAAREAYAIPTIQGPLAAPIGGVKLPSESGDANAMHTAMEQALREREHVKLVRFAPGPLAFRVAIDGSELWHGPEGDGPVGYRTCTLYAGPYEQGYTNWTKPNEYALLCDGRRVSRYEDTLGPGFDGIGAQGYSAGLTFDEVLAAVDGPLRSPSWGSDS